MLDEFRGQSPISAKVTRFCNSHIHSHRVTQLPRRSARQTAKKRPTERAKIYELRDSDEEEDASDEDDAETDKVVSVDRYVRAHNRKSAWSITQDDETHPFG